MEKSSTLNLRINPQLKHDAETVLNRLGIPMSTAIDMYLNQIVMLNAIPFSVSIPDAPKSIDVSAMTDEELFAKLTRGYKEAMNGEGEELEEFIKKFKKEHY